MFKGCLPILLILLFTVGAMGGVAAAYAYAASSQWAGVKWSLSGAAFCVFCLLLFTAKTK